MTARLRELAERWKRRRPTEGDNESNATELLSILDAEGDGGALAWLVHKDYETARAFTQQSNAESFAKQMCVPVIPLYPHPARSGVVSDEDVCAAVDAYNSEMGGIDCDLPKDIRDADHECMRAAIEHYERTRK